MIRLLRSTVGIMLASVVVLLAAVHPQPARAHIAITVSFGPPAIPYYVQPPCPTQNWIWSPGYWAYDQNDGGYYWVPGTWVPAPEPGLLWTPGYWGWNNGYYGWNPGYWATSVGFYGGVNYGYGYYGRGYAGGQWQGNRFRYNTAVSHVDRNHIHNVYANNAVVVHQWNRVSYNGGRGGIAARPTQSQLAVRRGHVIAATPVQLQHQSVAARNRANFSSVNHGRPAVAAVARPYSATNRAATAQHRAAPAAVEHRAAPAAVQHRAAPAAVEHRAAPAAVQQRAAPAAVQHHYAPAMQQRAAPAMQQRAAPAMQQRAAPAMQQRAAPAMQQRAAPAMQQRAAPPQQHAAPAGHDERR